MQGERKLIRDSFKAAIDGKFSADVYAKRFVDRREISEYVNIFFDEGDIDFEGLNLSTTALITVGYHTNQHVDDDELDEIGDTIFNAIGDSDIAPDVIRGVIPQGFSYGDEQEQEFTSLFLRFTVIY